MSTQLPTDIESVEVSVDEWRFQQLLTAGWPEQEALLLAGRHDIDLHLACELLEDGCEPELAWHILY
jgi:hypothetical protein